MENMTVFLLSMVAFSIAFDIFVYKKTRIDYEKRISLLEDRVEELSIDKLEDHQWPRRGYRPGGYI